jgi:hypothetical protein
MFLNRLLLGRRQVLALGILGDIHRHTRGLQIIGHALSAPD